MAVKRETELYAPLKIFFEKQGYVIKGEVRSCDLVGVRGDGEPPLVVEMKKTFNLSLLLQGVERLKLSPVVYLAVERCREKKGAVSQRWGELTGLCRRLGLGLVTVIFYKTKPPLVEVLAEPEALPMRTGSGGRRQERLLYEFNERSGDYNTGGSARVKLVTAYREKALRVAAALEAATREAALAAAEAAASAMGSVDAASTGTAGATGSADAASTDMAGATGSADAANTGKAGATGSADAASMDTADAVVAETVIAARAIGAATPVSAQGASVSAMRGVTPAELRRRSGVPAAAAILQNNYYGWFKRVARGRYTLTAAGNAALMEYAAVSVSQALADRKAAAEKSDI